MRIGIPLPDALLSRIDRRARKAGLNRSRLIARGLEALFRAEDKKRLTGSFDSVFSDKTLRAEQSCEAELFDSLPFDGGSSFSSTWPAPFPCLAGGPG